jgi:hypothetical protein
MVIHLKPALCMLTLAAATVAIVPAASAHGPCPDGLYACIQPNLGPCHSTNGATVCVSVDPATGCADVSVGLPPPFSQPLPIHQCSPVWVTVGYAGECFTITVSVPPPLSQPLPIVVCR